jgi:hypothetical protein
MRIDAEEVEQLVEDTMELVRVQGRSVEQVTATRCGELSPVEAYGVDEPLRGSEWCAQLLRDEVEELALLPVGSLARGGVGPPFVRFALGRCRACRRTLAWLAWCGPAAVIAESNRRAHGESEPECEHERTHQPARLGEGADDSRPERLAVSFSAAA